VTDWHTPLVIQGALAQFIDDGGFERHARGMNRVYEARHRIIVRALGRDFAGHLEVIPSDAGLHVCAPCRNASAADIESVVRRAADVDVAVQTLSRLGVEAPARPGLVLGYGAIRTTDIEGGLSRLRRCFDG
jgi:GntR family transcriptional regulator/MocR family aminotransferase